MGLVTPGLWRTKRKDKVALGRQLLILAVGFIHWEMRKQEDKNALKRGTVNGVDLHSVENVMLSISTEATVESIGVALTC